MAILWAVCVLSLVQVAYGMGLDAFCGSEIYAPSFLADTYTLTSSSVYRVPCIVHFNRHDYGKTQLTISGNNLDSSTCRVNVFGEYNSVSLTGGNIVSLGYFSRTVKSNNLGELYLHVQGTTCITKGLVFTVKQVPTCTGFTCDNGQCVLDSDVCDGFDDCSDGSDEDGCFYWTTGSYVGVSVGVFVFIFIVAGISGAVYRRRRMVVVGSPGLINTSQTVVTQSRW